MARALMIGAGGLGSPALLALATAGMRNIGIIDPDRVELSNLHRQILYREADVGSYKVDCAERYLLERFGTTVEKERALFNASKCDLADYDLVLDGTDRFETKLAISDACVDAGVDYVFAGVAGFEGQVLGVRPHQTACLRCLFDEAPPPGAAATCDQLGILGPIAGIVAAEQVRVALRLLEDDLSVADRIWIYDGSRDVDRTVRLKRRSDCKGCGSNKALRGALVSDGSVEQDAPVLNLVGLSCPATFIETKKALTDLELKGRLWVHLSSDESARNVPASAVAAGHKVLAQKSDGETHRILIERGEDA